AAVPARPLVTGTILVGASAALVRAGSDFDGVGRDDGSVPVGEDEAPGVEAAVHVILRREVFHLVAGEHFARASPRHLRRPRVGAGARPLHRERLTNSSLPVDRVIDGDLEVRCRTYWHLEGPDYWRRFCIDDDVGGVACK